MGQWELRVVHNLKNDKKMERIYALGITKSLDYWIFTIFIFSIVLTFFHKKMLFLHIIVLYTWF